VVNLAHWLERQAQITPERPALFFGKTCVADYGQFWREARAVAGWLSGQGVGPGDRVALFMKNVPDYLTVFYGIWAVG
ncbi:AMP-binding protein, partial [Roseobacter litoralis]|uniref:AMP-binding protein n=1 Tax=Roseobacter litoralis TaxID=42443 RepID=UPI0031E5BD6D